MLVNGQAVIRAKGAAAQPSYLSQPAQERDSALPSGKLNTGPKPRDHHIILYDDISMRVFALHLQTAGITSSIRPFGFCFTGVGTTIKVGVIDLED